MKTALCYARWFIIGMGHVMGISQSLPRAEYRGSAMDAIGGDFRAVGNDIQLVMQKYPPRQESVRPLGHRAEQMELAGIN